MTATFAATRDRTKLVHKAMRKVLGDLDYGLSIVAIYVDSERVIVRAPNIVAARKWEATYPERHVSVDGHLVPLHVAVEGVAS